MLVLLSRAAPQLCCRGFWCPGGRLYIYPCPSLTTTDIITPCDFRLRWHIFAIRYNAFPISGMDGGVPGIKWAQQLPRPICSNGTLFSVILWILIGIIHNSWTADRDSSVVLLKASAAFKGRCLKQHNFYSLFRESWWNTELAQHTQVRSSFFSSSCVHLLYFFDQAGFHRITESQNGRGWKGPLWVI